MSFFSDIDQVADSEVKTENPVRTGGFLVDSGAQEATIEVAYFGESQGGAKNMTVHLKTESGATVRITEYYTSGQAKGVKNYYIDKNSGAKKFLPGFSLLNDMCLLSSGKPLTQQNVQEKMIKLYSFDAGQEVPTKVFVPVDLIGKKVVAGFIKQIVDKRAKAADGSYQPTGETREENIVEVFFSPKDKRTVFEILNKIDESLGFDKWQKRNEGETRDKSTKAKTGAPVAGAPIADSQTVPMFG